MLKLVFQLNAPRPKNKLSKKKPAWYQVRALCSRQCKRTRIWRCLKRNQRRDKERSRRKLRRSTRSSRTTRATRAPSRPTPKRMTKPRSGQAEAGGSASDAMIVVGDQPNANDTKQEEVIDREEWRLQQKQQLKRPIAESLSTDSNAGQAGQLLPSFVEAGQVINPARRSSTPEKCILLLVLVLSAITIVHLARGSPRSPIPRSAAVGRVQP
ncbi:hypothetical protein pipiens_017481 [Culex pipiens pipiens]|uniref:Uncharacterized protein n=1 Tax=Culex pipiens pipiens TaxID=38569 RepID=A0ABD1CH54_CULPP